VENSPSGFTHPDFTHRTLLFAQTERSLGSFLTHGKEGVIGWIRSESESHTMANEDEDGSPEWGKKDGKIGRGEEGTRGKGSGGGGERE
jgi:hypothetical protein